MDVEPLLGHAYVRFYGELNDHLPSDRRQRTLERTFLVPGTVKDMIESLGVPHTEVELIIVNRESVPFSYLVQDGDRIAVYPMFESFDVAGELRVRPKALREPRFVLDVHLGKLASYLRMLGFDAVYGTCSNDLELIRASCEQRRTLLTRDRGLLKYSAVTHGYLVRENESRRQVAEILKRFHLAGSVQPFTRCMICNGSLVFVSKEQVLDQLPPRAAALFEEFRRCPDCGRIYWKGSHYQRMRRWIDELVSHLDVV